eukprot:GILI01013342.1.p1 GENE.GILI01013342.1~~GILI01013342.1.p1  ORF type:complete len:507 (+),score=70.78 GILI01013342.1:352-1872(+)
MRKITLKTMAMEERGAEGDRQRDRAREAIASRSPDRRAASRNYADEGAATNARRADSPYVSPKRYGDFEYEGQQKNSASDNINRSQQDRYVDTFHDTRRSRFGQQLAGSSTIRYEPTPVESASTEKTTTARRGNKAARQGREVQQEEVVPSMRSSDNLSTGGGAGANFSNPGSNRPSGCDPPRDTEPVYFTAKELRSRFDSNLTTLRLRLINDGTAADAAGPKRLYLVVRSLVGMPARPAAAEDAGVSDANNSGDSRNLRARSPIRNPHSRVIVADEQLEGLLALAEAMALPSTLPLLEAYWSRESAGGEEEEEESKPKVSSRSSQKHNESYQIARVPFDKDELTAKQPFLSRFAVSLTKDDTTVSKSQAGTKSAMSTRLSRPSQRCDDVEEEDDVQEDRIPFRLICTNDNKGRTGAWQPADAEVDPFRPDANKIALSQHPRPPTIKELVALVSSHFPSFDARTSKLEFSWGQSGKGTKLRMNSDHDVAGIMQLSALPNAAILVSL